MGPVSGSDDVVALAAKACECVLSASQEVMLVQ